MMFLQRKNDTSWQILTHKKIKIDADVIRNMFKRVETWLNMI